MPLLGEFSALLTAVCWSFSSLLFAAAASRMGSMELNLTRLIIALAYLLILIPIAGFDTDLSTTQVVMLGISGVVGFSLGDTFLFKAYQEMGARLTMLLLSMAPAVAAILAYALLDETLSVVGVAGIGVTICGIALVVMERNPAPSLAASVTLAGVALGALAAACQGVGLIFAKLAFREGPVNGFVATALRIGAALVVLLPVGLAWKRVRMPWRLFRANPQAFGLASGGAALGPFLGVSFSLIAIAHTDVGIAATIMATVPVLMLPLGRFVANERLSARAIAGAFVAVGGVGILFLR